MDNNLPLTVEEAAQILKVSKYTLYEMVKRGEIKAQRLGRQLRIHPEALKRYVQVSSNQGQVTAGENQQTAASKQQAVRFMGSHDPVIELLVEFLQHTASPVPFYPTFTGSMEGLISLYKRQADVVGVHLWDDKTEEYNLPFVRYVLAGEQVTVVNLVQRVQGWIVQTGNPLNLNQWEDVGRKGLRFVNRQTGSGTRLRLDAFLRKAGISPGTIEGYDVQEETHFGVACRVANGEADAGIGVQSAANRLGLGFIPLFTERYDLVCLQETSQTLAWQHLLAILNSKAFHTAVKSQAGYDTALTGKVIYEG